MLGAVVYHMATGHLPHPVLDEDGVCTKIKAAFTEPVPKTYSRHLRALLPALLAVDPGKRPTAAQVLSCADAGMQRWRDDRAIYREFEYVAAGEPAPMPSAFLKMHQRYSQGPKMPKTADGAGDLLAKK